MKNLRSPAFYGTAAIPLMVLCGVTMASPVVVGNTISWPDDGWYQVQRSDDFQTVCEGGRSCVVESGNFVVINHDSGERWESVRVDGQGNTAVQENTVETSNAIDRADFRLSGNVIDWTAQGWFQVQDVATFNTVCESDESSPCQVSGGVYNIINLSTATRWENIRIPGGDTENLLVNSAPDLQAGLLTWNGSGYFQVQDTDTFETLCEGSVNQCDVGNRPVQLINLSSGQRWENLAQLQSSTFQPNPVPFSGGVGPVVSGLRGVVYTDSEIEIFWNTTGSDTGTVAYQIFRDGVQLDTRDALSFYENNLQPGRTYQYGVAAVVADGAVGPQSFLQLTTPARVDGINADNFKQRLNYLTDLMNAPPMLRWIEPISEWVVSSSDVPNENFIFSHATFSPTGTTNNHDCAGGGVATRITRLMSGAGVTDAVTFENCVLADGSTMTGSSNYELRIQRWVGNSGITTTLSFDLDIVDSNDQEIHLQGSRFINGGENLYSIRHIIELYSSPAFEGRTTITDYEVSRSIGQFASIGLLEGVAPTPWVSDFEARLTVQAPATDNRPVTVSTPEILATNNADSCYETGELLVEAQDGSQLRLLPAAGSADEMEIVIRTSQNSVMSELLPWLGNGLDDIIRQPSQRMDTAPVRVWGLCGGRYLND